MKFLGEIVSAQRPHSLRRVIEGLCWIAFAVSLMVASRDFSEPLPMFEWGAAFWPRVMLVGVVIAAVALIVSAFFVVEHPGESDGEDEPGSGSLVAAQSWSERGRIMLMFGVPVVYVFAMHKLGFLLVTPIFLITYMYIFGVRRWVPLLVVSLSIYTVIIMIFVKLIFTPLPQGAGIFYSINGHLLGLIQ